MRRTAGARSALDGANIMTDRTATVTFSDGSPSITFPILAGNDRPGGHRHPLALREIGDVHLRPGGSCQLGPAACPSPISTATRACCFTAAIRSSSSRSIATSSRSATSSSTGSCRTPSRKRVRRPRSPTIPWCIEQLERSSFSDSGAIRTHGGDVASSGLCLAFYHAFARHQ